MEVMMYASELDEIREECRAILAQGGFATGEGWFIRLLQRAQFNVRRRNHWKKRTS